MSIIENGGEFVVGFYGDIYGMPLSMEDGVQMTVGYHGMIKRYIQMEGNLTKAEVFFNDKRSPMGLKDFPMGIELEFHGDIQRISDYFGSGNWNGTEFVMYKYKVCDDSHTQINVRKRSYLVKEGDSLRDIAEQATGNPTDFRLIAALNNIENPNSIRPGDILHLPVVNCLMVWFSDKGNSAPDRVDKYVDYFNDGCLQRQLFRAYYGGKMFGPDCANSEQCQQFGYNCKNLNQVRSICQIED